MYKFVEVRLSGCWLHVFNLTNYPAQPWGYWSHQRPSWAFSADILLQAESRIVSECSDEGRAISTLSAQAYLFNWVFHNESNNFDLFLLSEPQYATDCLFLNGRIPLRFEQVNSAGDWEVVQSGWWYVSFWEKARWSWSTKTKLLPNCTSTKSHDQDPNIILSLESVQNPLSSMCCWNGTVNSTVSNILCFEQFFHKV